MSEQQYRVIADRASMADESWIAEGDRVTYGSVSSTGELVIVRIERPLPTTDEPEDETQDLRTQVANLVPLSMLDGRDPRANVFEVADEIISAVLAAIALPLPTREQIAEAISQAVGGYNQNTRTIQHAADAVLALIQNGADR